MRFVIVVLTPVPEIFPGLIVHVPVEGNPFKITLPVGVAQDEGWVIAPTEGAAGVPGGEIITISVEGRDIHPAAVVMLKLYVPGTRFEIIVLVPVPEIAPGLIIHVPVAGRPFKTTVPVGTAHREG
jgi:hypothetical protein